MFGATLLFQPALVCGAWSWRGTRTTSSPSPVAPARPPLQWWPTGRSRGTPRISGPAKSAAPRAPPCSATSSQSAASWFICSRENSKSGDFTKLKSILCVSLYLYLCRIKSISLLKPTGYTTPHHTSLHPQSQRLRLRHLNSHRLSRQACRSSSEVNTIYHHRGSPLHPVLEIVRLWTLTPQETLSSLL